MTDAAEPTCPICGRPSAPEAPAGRRSLAPFCSTRCADVDLGRWFTGQYRIPVDDPSGEENANKPNEHGDRRRDG